MTNKKRLLAWLLLVTAATVLVAVASLLVLRLPDPWNWLIPLMFLALINVVGFLADVVGVRSALLGGQSAPGSSIQVTKSRDVVKPALRCSTEGHPLTKPTVFISYSHADRKFIDQLVDKLQASGVAVWIDKWMIKVGDSITQRIDEGIGSSDFLIVVLSRASLKSKWVREELNAATIRNVEEEKHAFVLPILLEECEIPLLLQHRKYADFTDDPEQAFQELLEVIQPELEAPLLFKLARKNGDVRDYPWLQPRKKTIARFFLNEVKSNQARLEKEVTEWSSVRTDAGGRTKAIVPESYKKDAYEKLRFNEELSLLSDQTQDKLIEYYNQIDLVEEPYHGLNTLEKETAAANKLIEKVKKAREIGDELVDLLKRALG